MKLLLDTHILIWLLEGNQTLSPKVKQVIEDETNALYLSIVSLWEIDWAEKWEQWFAECEALPIPTATQSPQNDYTALLIDKYCKQGLEL
jgi:PIN domain nuclease of toxin-antitoxin system